jgi:transcription factor IIIB subunit 2
MRCPVCGSTDIEYDTSRADQACTNCGYVLEESGVVAEVQFEETSNGGVSALGSFVPSEGMKGLSQSARSIGGVFGSGGGLHSEESREISLRKASQRIRRVADQLKLTEHMVEQSLLVYKLALQNQFTRGRTALVVIGACIYVTCRREKTPHMLLDVAEAIQAPLFYLGKTYLRLIHVLKLRIHVIDPSLYIHRFASALGLGKKTHLVSMTALRLVARMKRDWIQTGRRPAGICGGCLVIAARLHGFQIQPAQVAKVVKMHESTVFKRMKEFANTPSSDMTLEQFSEQKNEIATECNPPSFEKGRAKNRKRKAVSAIVEEPSSKRASMLPEEDAARSAEEAARAVAEAQREIEAVMLSEDLTRLHDAVLNDEDLRKAIVDAMPKVDPEPMEDDQEEEEDADVDMGVEKKSKKKEVEFEKPAPPIVVRSGGDAKSPKPTVLVDMKAALKKLNGEVDDDVNEEPEEEELNSDLDDDEVRSMVVSDANIIKFKEKIWDHLHHDYLEEQAEKKRVAEMEAGKPKRKYNRKTPSGPRTSLSGSSAADAAGKALSRTSTSSKINYAALQAILGDSGK